MKICIITYTLFSHGGKQRVITNIANELSNYHDITVLCTKKTPKNNIYNLALDKIKVDFIEQTIPGKLVRNFITTIAQKTKFFTTKIGIRLYPFLFYTPVLRRSFVKYINNNQFDLVISTSIDILLASITSQIDAKAMNWLHTSYEGYFEKIKGGANFKFLARYYLPKLDQLIVLSKNDEKIFRKEISSKTNHIYNPLSFEPVLRTTLDNKKFVGVGTLSRMKGFHEMIDAFYIFSKQNSDWTFEIYGDGQEKDRLQKQIDDYGLSQRIRIFPYTNDVEQCLAKGDVFLFSSRFEGFGLVLTEALSCGLPLIVTDIPITRELLEDEKVAEFYTIGDVDRLTDLMIDYSNRDLKEMSERAMNLSKKFRLKDISDKWLNIINKIEKND